MTFLLYKKDRIKLDYM